MKFKTMAANNLSGFCLNLDVSVWNYVGEDQIASEGNDGDLEKIISEIKNDGFGVELFMNWSPDKKVFARRNWGRLSSWLAGSKDLTIHSECSSKDFAEISREIELARYLDARVLVVHVLNFGVVELENKLEIDRQYLKKVLELAEENGVVLALENGSFKLLQKFCDIAGNSDNLKICLDIGHANIPASSKAPKSWSDPIGTFVQKFGDRIVHFHIHDNFGKNDDHLIPGEGSIDWQMVIEHLKGADSACCATLELFYNISDPRQAALQSRDFLDKLES